jgi:hypothetical protein
MSLGGKMTSESRIWTFFVLMTLAIDGLLVLLRTDGISSKTVFAIAMLVLAPPVLLFMKGWRQPVGSKTRTLFYRWAAFCFLALTAAHFIADKTTFR